MEPTDASAKCKSSQAMSNMDILLLVKNEMHVESVNASQHSTLHRLWNTLCKLCYSHFLSLSWLGNWRNWQLMKLSFLDLPFSRMSMQSPLFSFPWNKYCFCHTATSSLGIIFSSSFFQSLIDQADTSNIESSLFTFLSQLSFTINGSCQIFLRMTYLFARRFRFLIVGWTISLQHFLHLSSVPLSLKYTLNYKRFL